MTRDYLEGFLKNVANGSQTLTSPYAVTTQYRDGGTVNDRAANKHLYGGGCIDYGQVGESTCRFPNAVLPAPGRNYPTPLHCTVSGTSYDPVDQNADPATGAFSNTYCLTDADIQAELSQMVTNMGLDRSNADGLHAATRGACCRRRSRSASTAAEHLCSANSSAPSRFCSYHSLLTVQGTRVAYVVQPWTAYTGCDLTNAPPLQQPTDSGRSRGRCRPSARQPAESGPDSARSPIRG